MKKFKKTLLSITISICTLLLTSSVSKAASFHTAEYSNYKNPLQIIEKLENQTSVFLNRSSDEYFQSQITLIELYFKTERFSKAEKVLIPLESQFKNKPSYHPKLALIKAHLMLQNQETEGFLEILKPHLGTLKNTQFTTLHTCYLYLLGSYQIKTNQFAKAFTNLTQALDNAKASDSTHLETSIKAQLVQLFYYTKQYLKALELNEEVISTALQHGDKFTEVSALTNKMNLYYVRAVHFAKHSEDKEVAKHPTYQRLIQTSNELQQRVYSLAREATAYRSMARSLILKQSQSFANNNFKQAVTIGKQVIELAQQHHYQYESAVASNNMAIAFREMAMFEDSISALKAAESYYQQIENQQSLSWIYEDYAITHEKNNNYKKALEYYKKYHKTSLEFLNKTNNQTMLELQEKYDTKEKTQEISRLTQQSALDSQQLKTERMKRWLLIVILIAVFCIALVLYQKRKHLKASYEQEAAINQKIIEVNQAKQRFFANLSHEFRTALTLSIGPLKRLLSQEEKVDDNVVFLESALENNLHMMTLLNEVLEIEKIDTKTLPIHVSKFQPSLAISQCLNRFLLEFQEKKIRINQSGFDSDLAIYFDPSHFEKIVSNILSNAAKYCIGDCTIDLKLSFNRNYITLVICDDGPGIKANELPYIFNRFYQGKHSTSQQQPGTGIGLSMVKELIELHHGTVEVSNKSNGGCCVKLEFKRGKQHYSETDLALSCTSLGRQQTDDSQQQNRYSATAEEWTSTNLSEIQGYHQSADFNNNYKKVILVIDDNANIRQLVRGILQPEYHVIEAENGRQGLALAESIQPDLVIADVMMPLLNGFQLTEQLRNNKRLGHLSIILLTALSGSDKSVQGLVMGADDYITKPFDNDELKARVKSHLLQKHRLSEALFDKYKTLLDKSPNDQVFEAQDTKRSKQLEKIITSNLSSSEFDVEQMYCKLNMTRSSLYRYTQRVYGCSPMSLLKQRRLELAYQMLRDYKGTISEVAYAVGYQSLSAFSRAFREYYKYPPTKVKKDSPESRASI